MTEERRKSSQNSIISLILVLIAYAAFIALYRLMTTPLPLEDRYKITFFPSEEFFLKTIALTLVSTVSLVVSFPFSLNSPKGSKLANVSSVLGIILGLVWIVSLTKAFGHS